MIRAEEYFTYFPHFDAETMKHRLSVLPVHIATLLDPKNLGVASRLLGRSVLSDFLSQSAARQRIELCEVFRAQGIPNKICDAFLAVPRHAFCPPSSARFAYLNCSIPSGVRGSCLSAPGLVALMLAQLPSELSGRIVEAGAGSGFHLSLVQHLYRGQNVELVGLEEDRSVPIDRGRLMLSGRLVHGNWRDLLHFLGEDSIDLLFATFSVMGAISAESVGLRDGGLLQMPRQLTEDEFFALRPNLSVLDVNRELYEIPNECMAQLLVC